MSKQLKIHGFIIRVGKGHLCKVIKPASKYENTIMVVIPFTIYNLRTTRRRFANDYYSYIVKGNVQKTKLKADYAFSDSLINKQINPKEIVSGFIRIPYEGRGTYGIRFYDVNNKKPISIERPITAIPASGSLLINKENDPPTPLELTLKPKRETINSNAPSRPKITKAAKSKTKNTLGSTKLKGNRPTDDYIVRTGETDIYDDYINAETSRGAEYGHGRKRSSEWNKATALDFRKELEELLKKRAKDSNEFDRQAMK